MKHSFNNKGVSWEKIILIEGEDIISDNTAVAEKLNTVKFGYAESPLDIASAYKYNIDNNTTVGPIIAIINTYSDYSKVPNKRGAGIIGGFGILIRY